MMLLKPILLSGLVKPSICLANPFLLSSAGKIPLQEFRVAKLRDWLLGMRHYYVITMGPG